MHPTNKMELQELAIFIYVLKKIRSAISFIDLKNYLFNHIMSDLNKKMLKTISH